MKKAKKILGLLLAVVLVVALSVTATLAYLTDKDSAKNVMTVGNVQIEQIEQERDADGNLVDFQDNKPLFPVTGPTPKDGPNAGKLMYGYNGYIRSSSGVTNLTYPCSAFDNSVGVIDKIVTVKNTGTYDAYIRTLFAFEMEKVTDSEGNVTWNDPVNVDVITVQTPGSTGVDTNHGTGIAFPKDENGEYLMFFKDDIKYIVGVFYYQNYENGAWKGSILKPGEVSCPSLTQIYLKSTIGNEFFEQVGDKYDILVLSQAAQAAGFENAKTALDTAFGEVTAENAGTWFASVND